MVYRSFTKTRVFATGIGLLCQQKLLFQNIMLVRPPPLLLPHMYTYVSCVAIVHKDKEGEAGSGSQ